MLNEKNLKLREWQEEAHNKCLSWLLTPENDRHFLINAAPGSGKTLCACTIAMSLLEQREIDRVVVIAPRSQVVSQWADDFYRVTRRSMARVTPGDGDLNSLELDICTTFQALDGLKGHLNKLCRQLRVLVICDEHHHAAVQAAWGDTADSAFNAARFVLILTGTPIRSDGSNSVWLAYDSNGAISHPEAGTYALSYGEAVDLGYCRPVTFHRHRGEFTVSLGSETIKVDGKTPPTLPKALQNIPGLDTSIDFYRLAKTPQYFKGTDIPSVDGYQGSMIACGIDKLNQLREEMPDAGGLIIAPNIDMADYMASILEVLDDERPVIVNSKMQNAEEKIKNFRNSSKKWLVSVAMISEGVDIKRLRVLIYLPNSLTELSFRQAIGRVVRSAAYDDYSRAYVVMPSFHIFEKYARRIEEEMIGTARGDVGEKRKKICPVCGSAEQSTAASCSGCGHFFPKSLAVTGQRPTCPSCGVDVEEGDEACHACGHALTSVFTITLNEALRDGAIVRGIDLGEEEVQRAEKLAPQLKNLILRSGDTVLIRLLQQIPEESLVRVTDFARQASEHHASH
jgi:hypothetical protein